MSDPSYQYPDDLLGRLAIARDTPNACLSHSSVSHIARYRVPDPGDDIGPYLDSFRPFGVVTEGHARGTPNMQDSSWTPPESVSASEAFDSNSRNSRNPKGSMIRTPGGVFKPNATIFFWVLGCIGRMTS